jgi:demethylmenaquinone methyltransferase/2-methoxy-6-polyprenyl-1,4-benzoquinol methylase
MTEPLKQTTGGASTEPEKIRGMFGAITPTYDRLNFLFSGSLDRHWRRLAAREATHGLEPCERLLDLATGTGDLARALADAAQAGRDGKGPRIAGADFTRPMLRKAVRKYGRDFQWIEADGLHLPLRDGEWDAVTIAFGLRNMADKPAALAEVARVVRPGGRVVILEFSQPQNPLFRALYDFYSFVVMPRVGHWISGSDAYLYLARSIREFLTPQALADEMRKAGLGEVKAIPLMFGVVYLHVGVKLG